MKDTYYFPHDYHARHDPKIKAMINDYGIEGYGMYWSIIEILYEQRDNKLEKFPKLFLGLATELCVSPDRVEKFIMSLIQEYRLLSENEGYIWSDAVLRRMEAREDKRLMKVRAGKMGGIISGIARRREAKRSIASSNEAKERKGKEIKGKESILKERKDASFSNPILAKLFENLWIKYPKKIGKKNAERHFSASVITEQDCKEIEIALEHYLKSERVFKGFIQNADTWFNNWKDWVNFKEDLCPRCKNKGKYMSTTGYESLCDCPAGRRLK